MSRRLDIFVRRARSADRIGIVLRVTIAIAVAGAVLATAVPAWDVSDFTLWVAVVAGAVGVVAPDAAGAAVVTVAVVVAWATGAPAGVGPAVVVTALCLLVLHVASALAAAMPVSARTSPDLLVRWLRPSGVIGAGTVATAGLAAVLDRWSPPGSVVLVLLALAALGGAAWWWTT